ncbi:phosphoglucomutase/phosphomannomutase, alpha/beta/alpha domain I domain-containing protein [Ditylenchus destructor]|uniref:Phosphoglucomutase/phosphomannomutase, alpha/beta/alpha domain I domain-containing protein n=1 Tax=Ditylenchus destructor TaxID=166010 RepID=A0AAD4N0V7_9BILA|nr:phosphoglucomutase/phosphomannomutase, alpha/beta/alpha domain I domain-containing protein [Ditylenchus destructor]
MACSDSELQQLVDKWLAWDKNEKTRQEIQDLSQKGDLCSLRSRMLGKLAFGTAGVRCRMEAGFARLNDLTVIQISHGMAKHVINEFGAQKLRGIAVGYDGRFNSKRFAELSANVFIQNGIKVYLFSDVVPTPVVSFATKALNCDAGLMVTASHNPKDDNGYKVYWSNGAQIIAPHDVEICRMAQAEPEPNLAYWNLENLHENPLLQSADDILENYYESESRMCYHREANKKSSLKITYSAFHGVGSKFARRLFEEYGIPKENIFYEQDEPDPTFPTVPFPNPEEGLKVLQLCIKTADESGSNIILANDPDADRLQLAEKQTDEKWRIFTGNEMGTLLTWWIYTNWRASHSTVDLSKVFILNSTVSSQIVKTMAEVEGFRNQVTLTGFKWMGNVADELRAQGDEVILAWEESIGFMAGSTLDKDGVSAAAIFAEIAMYLDRRGLKMSEQIFQIYKKYGFHLVRSSYWIVPNSSVTKQIFADLRKDQAYPPKIGSEAVQFVRDLTTGYDNSQPDNKAILPLSTSSEMLTFTLESGSIVTLRASGTEPKVKYYIELKTEPGKEEKDLDNIMQKLANLEKDVVETLLRPSHYGLISRDK